jgi:hypothetical protein
MFSEQRSKAIGVCPGPKNTRVAKGSSELDDVIALGDFFPANSAGFNVYNTIYLHPTRKKLALPNAFSSAASDRLAERSGTYSSLNPLGDHMCSLKRALVCCNVR